MVKKLKLVCGKSGICLFNTHTYYLTPENAYYTTSVNNHFYSTVLCDKLFFICVSFTVETCIQPKSNDFVQ